MKHIELSAVIILNSIPMEEEKSAFINKLDELISLFEKLKEKAKKEGIILDNDPLYGNFDMLSKNYELIKHNLPEDLLAEIGEPMQEMIAQMITQLKSEMGESFSSDTKSSVSSEINKIDSLLKQGNLSEKEINDLLDKRSKMG